MSPEPEVVLLARSSGCGEALKALVCKTSTEIKPTGACSDGFEPGALCECDLADGCVMPPTARLGMEEEQHDLG